MGFDNVYLILDKPALTDQTLIELAPQEMSEEVLRTNVLCAHKILMNLNEHNREQFKDLVGALECDAEEHTSSNVG